MDELFAAGGAQEWPRIADEEGALLLVPNGTNRDTGAPSGDDQNRNDCRPQGPTAADDVDFIDALLRWTADRFSNVTLSLDTARTFVTGPSNGGLMTYRLATELPDRVAAAAAFIANRPELSECPMATDPIPVVNRADTTERTVTQLPDRDPDDGSIVVCENDPPTTDPVSARVRFCRVEGGGHIMPSIDHRLRGQQNHDVEGARLAWSFFDRATSK